MLMSLIKSYRSLLIVIPTIPSDRDPDIQLLLLLMQFVLVGFPSEMDPDSSSTWACGHQEPVSCNPDHSSVIGILHPA